MDVATKTRLTRKELAERLGVKLRTIDGWRKRGVKGVRLAVELVGGSVWIRWADYLAFQAAVNRRRKIY